ncbi:RNA polymerase-binding protein RbpA [Solihabitans fulvus]|uniref:RNA polymerase-binding protein RbpA n=1 Tax=Solihabitans fulvus TaxID=1892852 RepID=UPI001661DB66|nr:RNA polymerase-binding protein RbpA [Solihabitans fulvus]
MSEDLARLDPGAHITGSLRMDFATALKTEVERDTDLAERCRVRFVCTHGHDFEVLFAADAVLPATWGAGSTESTRCATTERRRAAALP